MSHFTPPTVEEVQEYCFERGNAVDAQSFVDFYTSKGWYVGKTKMKDWKASVRTWEKNQRQKNKKSKDDEGLEGYYPAAIGQKRQQDNLYDNFIIHGGKKQWFRYN